MSYDEKNPFPYLWKGIDVTHMIIQGKKKMKINPTVDIMLIWIEFAASANPKRLVLVSNLDFYKVGQLMIFVESCTLLIYSCAA